jgi:hypothetical protein
MCVPRIQNREYMFQEYKTKNVCSKNTKQRIYIPRIQNKECVFQEYKTENVCSKNTKKLFPRLLLIQLGLE